MQISNLLRTPVHRCGRDCLGHRAAIDSASSSTPRATVPDMSMLTPSSATTAAGAPDRRRLVRRARLLGWLSVTWMLVEAGVATAAALAAGSVALLGFGLDSLIELASAAVVIWRFSADRDSGPGAERTAQELIALSFVLLAAYLTFDGIGALAGGSHVRVSWVGGAISAAAIAAMPLLAQAKHRVARQLGSAATSADAAQSWLCALAAAGVLVSIAANAVFGWWRVDAIIGFGIAALALNEAREAWRGETCAGCARPPADAGNS